MTGQLSDPGLTFFNEVNIDAGDLVDSAAGRDSASVVGYVVKATCIAEVAACCVGVPLLLGAEARIVASERRLYW